MKIFRLKTAFVVLWTIVWTTCLHATDAQSKGFAQDTFKPSSSDAVRQNALNIVMKGLHDRNPTVSALSNGHNQSIQILVTQMQEHLTKKEALEYWRAEAGDGEKAPLPTNVTINGRKLASHSPRPPFKKAPKPKKPPAPRRPPPFKRRPKLKRPPPLRRAPRRPPPFRRAPRRPPPFRRAPRRPPPFRRAPRRPPPRRRPPPPRPPPPRPLLRFPPPPPPRLSPPPPIRPPPPPPPRFSPPPPPSPPPPLSLSPPPPPSLQPPEPLSPPPPPPPSTTPSLPVGKEKYSEVLGLSWKFYMVQRSGAVPSPYPVPWIYDSMLTDQVPGGWHDAGDTLKLNFPLAGTASFLAWGLVEFESGYAASGHLATARAQLRVAIDYLAASQISSRQYVGQISEPNVDHTQWGRPSQYPHATLPRNAFIWDENTKQADLLGGVAAALASAAVAFKTVDPAYSAQLVVKAQDLWAWATQSEGLYHTAYPGATYAYPSSDWADHMVWGAAWLYRATGDASYLTAAQTYWARSGPDVYACWDSVWAPSAAVLLGLAADGVVVPGVETYKTFFDSQFLAAWLAPSGYWSVIQSPKGMAYPSWSQWGNLRYATTAAMVAAVHAKRNTDTVQRAAELAFAQRQLDYALGSGGRSFVAGWGVNPPVSPHHAASSCPDMPAPCDWTQFSAPGPNPQVLYGALVAGPKGPGDDTYYDKRDDYITNEVASDYNAGFTTALAGLYQLL